MAIPPRPVHSPATSLPWIWILEELVDMKDVETPILKEIMTYIPNIDTEDCSGLQRRISLRYLEEVLASGKIDARAIPLVKALENPHQNMQLRRKSGSLFVDKGLLLRVQTEAVLTHIRGRKEDGNRDWDKFKVSLNHIFPQDEANNLVTERRKELLTLLQTQDQEKACVEIFERHSLHSLRQDLFQFIILEKGRSGQTFLEQWCQEALDVNHDNTRKQGEEGHKKHRENVECNKETQIGNASSSSPGVNMSRFNQQFSAGSDDTTFILADDLNDSDDSEVANRIGECQNDVGTDQNLDKLKEDKVTSINVADGAKSEALNVSCEPYVATTYVKQREECHGKETGNIEYDKELSQSTHLLENACPITAVDVGVLDGHDGDLEEEVLGDKVNDGFQKSQDRRTRNSGRRHPLKSYRENRIIPGLRRKNLPWSKLEEDILKEGVERFSDCGIRCFQWTRILDFGQGTFHASRTSIDLKDKWRNLSKSSS